MAKATKTNTATVVIEDNASIGHNSATRVLDVAFDCGKSMAGSDGALTSLIKQHVNNETVLAAMQRAFYEGYVASRLNVDRLAAKTILDKGKFSALPTAKVDNNRTHAQERIYGAARVAFSRAKAFAEGPKPHKPKGASTTDTKSTKSTPVAQAAPQTVASLIIERAAKPEDVGAHMAMLLNHMRRYQALNATHFKGDAGAAWRDWMMVAPTI